MKIQVCRGPHCTYRGSDRTYTAIKTFFGARADVVRCECTGYCEEGPNVIVDNQKIYRHAKPLDIGERIEKQNGHDLVEITFEDLKIDEF